MKRLLVALVAAGAFTAFAEIPQDYYSSLEGKQGTDLRNAIKAIAEGHTRITYNTKTWPAFETTDVRMIGGNPIWWDMYSNNIVYLSAHDALNIEHAVANSWWGGKNGSNDAYSDLFHLNPSDQNANNTKSNHPWGETSDARLMDNGLTKIGTPVAGIYDNLPENEAVFEPADEYKGDFARAAFYLFTAYPDIPWKADSEYMYAIDSSNGVTDLRPAVAEMLMRWHNADPVDSKEINRNEAIYELQKNRNPFIDHPELADYIWGTKKEVAYAAAEPATAINRPAAPVFNECRMKGVNTYDRRWWDGFQLGIDYSGGKLMLSIDGRDYYDPTEIPYVDPAADMDDVHTFAAYVKANVNGHDLRSPIARLTLIPLDPDQTNYSRARWERVEKDSDIEDGMYYIILSGNTLHAMSTTGGVPNKGFLESAGFVAFDDENRVVEIPYDAAVVKLENDVNGKHKLLINDTQGNFKGYWQASAKNQMRLKDSDYTPATLSVNDSHNFLCNFDQYGSLQFNKTQPRFLNYESTQSPVYLYKLLDFVPTGGIESIPNETPWGVGVDSGGITVDSDTMIFDLSGRRVEGDKLSSGLYIVVGPSKTVKIVL